MRRLVAWLTLCEIGAVLSVALYDNTRLAVLYLVLALGALLGRTFRSRS